MVQQGYYRYPTVSGDAVVFVSEDDLWAAPLPGGLARRLTANLGSISSPSFSPDGLTLAFTGREEGPGEVYTMPAEGGPVRRLTFLGGQANVVGWSREGDRILFTSNYRQPFGVGVLHSVALTGGEPALLGLGPAVSISLGPSGRTVLGRNNNDPARWKRYRGGTAGDIWIDAEGDGSFRRLLDLRGNMARPMWIENRIYFLSDHEGVGNLYSCNPDGGDLRRHTHLGEYYVRFPNSDGRSIVFSAGADVWRFDPRVGDAERVEIRYPSPRVQRQRRFADAARYLETYDLHPQGHSLALTARGKSFTLGAFEGPTAGQGPEDQPVRLRLTRWLNDGERVVTVADIDGVDTLQIYPRVGVEPLERLEGLDIGRPMAMLVSPAADEALIANHRNELLVVDLKDHSVRQVDKSDNGGTSGMCWSADGRWVAYGFPLTPYQRAIKIWDRTTGEARQVTDPVLFDVDPVFDPEGKYLYFVGGRELNPVYDHLHFDLGFPRGDKLYLQTLNRDTASPFAPAPRGVVDADEPVQKPSGEGAADGEPAEDGAVDKKDEPQAAPAPVEIEFDGIQDRVAAFPVPEGTYGGLAAIKGKLLFLSSPISGALSDDLFSTAPKARESLESFDLKQLKQETLVAGVTGYTVSRDGKSLLYRSAEKLRLIKAGEKADDKQGMEPGRKSGFVDLGRVKVSIEPEVEWRQMAREAWRLQREYFWTEDMSGVDWNRVWDRYSPLIERVGTRGEFSDLMWEMQGELGTSHAYEFGGDYRPEPSYPQGFLGADFAFDRALGGYRIQHIVRGTAGDARTQSPLLAPGVNAREGDLLRAINGRAVSAEVTPEQLLVHQAGAELVLALDRSPGERHDTTVKALRSDMPARYREWVERNRERVHRETGGRVGYVHIPDMGGRGYAEFHRLFLTEVVYDAMVVDVRFNGGGHVSQLILEKLARKRLGYDVPRWGKPQPYPDFSVAGPMVAIANQWAGSDGDIFSHCFKLMKLGPLIGKRTWGGVIGIGPRNLLADGAITTQPEFSFWFTDVGWGVENYGTDPDVEIDVAPQDYAAGRDPQLEKAISMVSQLLEAHPPAMPSFDNRPRLPLP